jgi:VWFA-related protein
MRRTIPFALLVAALPLLSQQPVHVEPPVYVTAIDLVAEVRDAAGKLPGGLTPADFIVIEDGVERKVIGVDYLGAERRAAPSAPATAAPGEAPAPARLWQTVLYFETQMSSSAGRQRVASELAREAETLAQIGTVDVIFANPTPQPLLRNSRDPQAIRTALEAVSAHNGVNQLVAHRRRYLRERHEIASMADIKRNSPKGTKIEMEEMGGRRPEARVDMDEGGEIVAGDTSAKTVRPYIDEEIQLINRFRTNLVTWMSNYRRHLPRTLVVVTDGFDLDPLDFYSVNLNQGDEMGLRTHISQQALAKSANMMAGALAASGWTTLSVPADVSFADGWKDDASTSAIGRVHGSATKPRAGDKGHKALLYRPIDPLHVLAVETGGAVVANSSKVGEAIQGIDDRVRITYQVDRKPDGKARKVQVQARNKDFRVRSSQWAAASTPDEMAEARAIGLMNAGGFTGELPVKSSIAWSAATGRRKGMLEASAETTSIKPLLAAGSRGDFRFTLAIRVPEKGVFVTNHIIPGYKLDEGVFRVKTPVDFPEGTSSVVVVVEEMNTGLWGSSRIE